MFLLLIMNCSAFCMYSHTSSAPTSLAPGPQAIRAIPRREDRAAIPGQTVVGVVGQRRATVGGRAARRIVGVGGVLVAGVVGAGGAPEGGGVVRRIVAESAGVAAVAGPAYRR